MLRKKLVLFFIFSLAISLNSYSQTCYDCGIGSMGNFHASTNQTILGGTYDFNSFKIDSGVTLNVIGNDPLIIKVRELVEIDGILTAIGGSGQSGNNNTAGLGGQGFAGGANGAVGVVGSNVVIDGNSGSGTGAGGAGTNLFGGGGAGYAAEGASSNPNYFNGGKFYGDQKISQLIGGSGGGSGSSKNNFGSSGGGAGGGIIVIHTCNTFKIGSFGAIICDGGNGGSSTSIDASAGGGGSGGSIWIAAADIEIGGLISAKGGNGGFSILPNNNFANGGQGAEGRIRIDQIESYVYGTISPSIGYSEKPFITRIWRALDPACHNTTTGFIKARSNGGAYPYSYHWSNGATTPFIDNVPAGTYSVTVTDGNGCKQFDQVTLNNPEAITPHVLAKKPDCIGGTNGSIFISASGGKPWPIAKNLTTTLYGTTTSKGVMFDVAVSEQIQVLKFALSLDNFNTNNIEIWYRNGTFSGYEFDKSEWLPLGNYAIQGYGPDDESNLILSSPLDLGEGSYSFYIYNHNGAFNCVNSTALGSVFVFDHSISIYEGLGRGTTTNDVFSSAIETPRNFSGKIGYQVLNPSGKTFNYNWNNSNIQELHNLPAGNYPIKITDAYGCEVIAQARVEDPEPINVNPVIVKNPSCNGYTNGEIKIEPTGGNLFKNIETGFATNKKASGLMFSIDVNQTIDLRKLSLIVSASTNVELYIKQGGYIGYENNSIAWNAIGTYAINPVNSEMPSTIDIPLGFQLTAGIWSVFIYDPLGNLKQRNATSLGNVIASSAHMKIYSGITRIGNGNTFNTSAGSFADFAGIINYTIAGGAINFNWWNGSNNDHLYNLAGGNYPIEVYDIDGCYQKDTVKLIEPTIVTTTIASTVETDKLSDGTASINATGGSAPYYYYWTPIGQTGSTINGLPAGDYSVLIVDANGCNSYNKVTVDHFESPPIPKGNLFIVPNPSQDYFFIGKEVKGMENCQLRIFDSVGRLIVENQEQISKLMTTGLSLGRLSDGIYTIVVQDEDQVFSAKVTVIR